MIAYETRELLVSVQNVGLSYGPKTILRQVNAEIHNLYRENVEQGQIVCLLGPSGVGKTKLSRLIAGLEAPTVGTITLAETDGQMRPAARGRVRVVPQNYPLFAFLTVQQNLILAGRQRRPIEGPLALLDTMKKLVARFNLQPFLGLFPAKLSGGTRQRVAIACQLMCGGHYIVMDEPFSGQDPIMKRRACQLIAETAAMHTRNTIVLCTHDVTEGMSIADQVWVMGKEPGRDGGTIVKTYDLAAEGLAWRDDILHDPAFQARVLEVKDLFSTLIP